MNRLSIYLFTIIQFLSFMVSSNADLGWKLREVLSKESTFHNSRSLNAISANSSDRIGISESVVYFIVIGTALFFVFFGYRFLRISVILLATILGGFIGWIISKEITKRDDGQDNDRKDLIITIICIFAVLFGVFALIFKKTMLFVFGCFFGIQLASIVNVIVLHEINTKNPNEVGHYSMAISALVCGLLTCCATRLWYVFFTSSIGSYWAVAGVGYFGGGFPYTISPFSNDETNGTLSPAYYGYMAAFVVLTMIGMYVQITWTSKNVHHRHLHKHDGSDDDEDDEINHHKRKREHHRHPHRHNHNVYTALKD